jgi:hypothetical protein
MAEYVTCPGCGLKVLTADSLLGRPVRCYGCDARFEAKADPPAPPEPPRPAPALRLDSSPAPPRYRSDQDDDDEDWPFCPGCGRQVLWQDPACPHCGEEFEEEQAPRPARPFYHDVAQPVQPKSAPRHGMLLLVLATLSVAIGVTALVLVYVAIVGVPLGFVVSVLAARDLNQMRDGSVDARGRKLTLLSYITGVVGFVLGLLAVPVYMLFR